LALALSAALLSPACGLITAPRPTSTPTDTPAPTLTGTPTPQPQPVVAPTLPPAVGWQRHQTEEFVIWLPGTWVSSPLEREALEFMMGMWEATNPRVAEYLDFFIEAGLHEQIDFWAMDTEATKFVSNVVIVSVPVPVSPASYVTSTSTELERMAATIVSTDDALEIDGLPAARIEYRMPMDLPGSGDMVARGVQYAVFVDSSTYVLTFTTSEEQTNDVAPIFEMSANSLRVFRR